MYYDIFRFIASKVRACHLRNFTKFWRKLTHLTSRSRLELRAIQLPDVDSSHAILRRANRVTQVTTRSPEIAREFRIEKKMRRSRNKDKAERFRIGERERSLLLPHPLTSNARLDRVATRDKFAFAFGNVSLENQLTGKPTKSMHNYYWSSTRLT